MTLLEIQSSPRGELSDSVTLNKSFIEARKAEDTLKPKTPECGNILTFDKRVCLDLRKGTGGGLEAERMSEIGRMVWSISHDMRHSLTAIYADAEFLERHDICASVRADLLLEIQEAVLAMTERLDSLLHFGRSGRKDALVHERVSLVVEKAVVAVRTTLFDAFVTAGKPNGTGLGLTLARRIAEEHGGSVWPEEWNRERTAFTLSLTKNNSLDLEGVTTVAPTSPMRRSSLSFR
jgi:light-regulated signal transduction histidine kinase (bacteriophytochrome)